MVAHGARRSDRTLVCVGVCGGDGEMTNEDNEGKAVAKTAADSFALPLLGSCRLQPRLDDLLADTTAACASVPTCHRLPSSVGHHGDAPFFAGLTLACAGRLMKRLNKCGRLCTCGNEELMSRPVYLVPVMQI